MGLVRGQVKRLDIPGEPGEWVEIKKLPWGLLEGARQKRTDAVIERTRLMGAELFEMLRGVQTPDATATDPTNEYDRGFLLRHAVQAWSYDAELPDAVEELEEETAEWLAKEIVSFNSRVRTEAEQLDAMSPSISR
jgi:hypothetical protein